MYNSHKDATSKRGTLGAYRTYVKPEFRKGFEIPLLPYQQNGILTKPLWNTKEQIIRIIPGYDTETGDIFKQNTNCNEYATDGQYSDYLSDTFMMASTVQYFGERKQTFITDYAPGSDDANNYGGDTVINTFVRNVFYSVNATKKPKFGISNEMRKWAGKDGVLRFTKKSLLMQALIFKVNGKDNEIDDSPLVDDAGNVMPLLAVVSVDGKQTLHALMNALVEPANPGLPLDACSNNKYGGMAELDGNKLFLNPVQDQESGTNMLRPSVQAPGKGWTPTPYPLDADEVRSLWHPWQQIIAYMTAEEQCMLLAEEFGAPAVNYLVGTDPLYRGFKMPDEIAAQGYGQYAQFIGGVKNVTETINMTDTRKPVSALGGLSKNTPVVGLPKQATVNSDPLHCVQKNSGIDIDKLRETVNRIRSGASGVTADNTEKHPGLDDQAGAADMLLNDPDVLASMEEDPAKIGL